MTLQQSKKESKDKESIQSSTTPGTGHHLEIRKNTIQYQLQASQKVSPLPTGDHMAAINRQKSMTDTKHK